MRLILLSALLLSATPALAFDDAAPATGVPKKEKLVCKRPAVSESRVSRRVCKTAKQWKSGNGREDDEAKLGVAAKEGFFRSEGGSPAGAGGPPRS